jgi:outer membrane protein assembly factor BamD
MKSIMISPFFLIISLSISLSSCAIFGDPTEVDETTGLTDYEVLQKAEIVQTAKDWQRVIAIYEKAEKRFPNSKLAPQFKLNLAYAYKEFYQEEEAIAMLNKFIRSYPNHPAMDYAYYLKGVILFRDRGIFKEITFQDISDRDVSQLEESFKALKEMTQLFPNSEYYDDAKSRMIYLMNKIAERELFVARYYMKREAFIAALNRAKYVLENYPETVHQEEALVIQISAYKNLGINDLAMDSKRVLDLNFPDSRFAKQKNDNKSEKNWWEFWDILD